MGAVLEERHVLARHDLRHDTLVAVTAGHLVARLDLALHGDEDLDHLHHARGQLVTALQLLHLVDEALLEALAALVVGRAETLDLRHQVVVGDGELPPLRPGDVLQRLAGDHGVLLEALRAGHRHLAVEHLDQTAVDVAIEDRLLVVAVLGEALDLLALDRHGALVLLDAVAVEHAHFDDRSLHARGTRSDVSRTSEAFSPKMARRSFSSGVIGLSPFGVILPTRMSPAFTSAPI